MTDQDDTKPAIGPKILGVAPEQKPLPIVKARLREKPKREPLPWPALRELVEVVKADLDTPQLKELFRQLPIELRDETTAGVREFRKGARRPLSQHAAKQLARAVHTSKRLKKKSAPSTEVSQAISQAMIAELIASLDVELAAEVILPKRDILDREAKTARRKAQLDEDREKNEKRRRDRDDSKGMRGNQSFGEFRGPKIKGLEALNDLFADAAPEPEAAPDPPADAEQPAPTSPEE
ncbi:MAG TPA: hypothetical protein VNT22_04455 [Baekduia sp.]|nr:hypothetical protein [Baekduia sp.]